MFGAILKATNSSFQKGISFCRSIYVKKVMKLLAFIFEQPSYSIFLDFIENKNMDSDEAAFEKKRTPLVRVGSHVVSVRIHCTEKWQTSFHTDV